MRQIHQTDTDKIRWTGLLSVNSASHTKYANLPSNIHSHADASITAVFVEPVTSQAEGYQGNMRAVHGL